MNKRTSFIVVALLTLIVGCGEDENSWSNAVNTHKCNAEQLEKVFKLAKQCLDSTSYITSYCTGISIISVCEEKLIDQAKEA